jgi:hypothetical protein
MIIKKLSFSLLFLTTIIFGQEGNTKSQNSIVTVSLLSPTYSYVPRWNIGYIRKIDQRLWAGIEIGYGNFKSSIGIAAGSDEFIYNKYKLFEIRPEIFYDLRPKSKLKYLLSAEIFFISHTDVLKNNWYYNTTSYLHYTFESAEYKRKKYGVNINYTMILNISKRIALSPKIGFGFKYRNVKFSNLLNAAQTTYDYEQDNWTPSGNDYIKDSGTANNVNFNFDIKLAYRL